MSAFPSANIDEFEAMLEGSEGRLGLAHYLRDHSTFDDDLLGQLIDIEGRYRVEHGLPVTLAHYFTVIPRLREKPAALDAAIEMTLRSLSRSNVPTPDAVETLIENYPDLRSQIIDAARLSLILWNTSIAAGRGRSVRLELPCDFGESRPDGSRPYRLIREIGYGSSAVVYEGIDLGLSDADTPATVAIKVFHRDGHADADPTLADEARKARRIEHRHVVRVLQHGVNDQSDVYIVYDFVRGGNLHEHIERGGPLPQARAARLVEMIARGLQAAHAAGLVHRDLKPANILLTQDDEPRIADFGSARRSQMIARAIAATPRSDKAAEPCSAEGTIAFMAPEQYRVEDTAMDPPVDIYALGGILYYCLTGLPPNGSSAREVAEALSAGALRNADRFAQSRDFDPDLRSIVLRALERDPARRFNSPAEMADDLAAWLRSETIRWTRPTLGRRARLLLRRHRRVAAALLAGLVIAAAVGAYALVKRQELANKKRADQALLQSISRARESITALARQDFLARQVMMHWTAVTVFAHDPRFQSGRVDAMWLDRLKFADQILARYEKAGSGDSFEAQLWRTCRALWLLDADRPADARTEAARAADYWKRTLTPDDAWTHAADGLLACAETDLLLSRPPQSAAARRAESENLLERLHRADQGVEILSDAALFRMRFVDRLVALLAPEVLNRPAEHEQAKHRYEELREFLGAGSSAE